MKIKSRIGILFATACFSLGIHPGFAQYDPCASQVCRIHFAPGNCELKDSSLPILDEAVRILKADSKSPAKIQIQGHTDNLESPNQAMQLSLCRAQSAEKYLEKKGIPASRIAVTSEGAGKPLVSNDIEPGREQNRRVEILLPGGPK